MTPPVATHGSISASTWSLRSAAKRSAIVVQFGARPPGTMTRAGEHLPPDRRADGAVARFARGHLDHRHLPAPAAEVGEPGDLGGGPRSVNPLEHHEPSTCLHERGGYPSAACASRHDGDGAPGSRIFAQDDVIEEARRADPAGDRDHGAGTHAAVRGLERVGVGHLDVVDRVRRFLYVGANLRAGGRRRRAPRRRRRATRRPVRRERPSARWRPLGREISVPRAAWRATSTSRTIGCPTTSTGKKRSLARRRRIASCW